MRIVLDTEGMNLETYIRTILGRYRIKKIYCSKDLITDMYGRPKTYHSLTALQRAEDVEGICPFFIGDTYYDGTTD